ncbi:phosphohydrolase [candidate division MSBL1 archaeon SCGC-AAA382K21]|uniref:Phosphohydrolase n=1 Tax=candidate division MSBL1 archaeon SCGC-AAA382K21 TaxID=1698283 RepID=A0A133VLW2_9EURY|nr:phosphohydrolase [candidate division MSBL1 archaeon SCGC-AAA382K21]
MDLGIPINDNKKLERVSKVISKNKELDGYLKSANVNAMDRLKYSDHGPTHIKIVANAALKILRILVDRDVTPSIVENHGFDLDDAEVEVVLAATLHDIGMAVHRKDHDQMSVFLGQNLLQTILDGIYENEEKAIMISEILGTLFPHDGRGEVLTVEAGILAIADALDMAEGRARIPFEAGQVDIHSVSAMAINKVEINEGKDGEKPVKIKIIMNNSAGVFQVDELLKKKVQASGLQEYFDIVAEIASEEEEKEEVILRRFEF